MNFQLLGIGKLCQYLQNTFLITRLRVLYEDLSIIGYNNFLDSVGSQFLAPIKTLYLVIFFTLFVGMANSSSHQYKLPLKYSTTITTGGSL